MSRNKNYGYDSNGGMIDESTVYELYRIADREILRKSKLSELGNVSIYEDSFDYFYTGTAFGASVKYYMTVYTDSNHLDLMNYVKRNARDCPDFNSDACFAELGFAIDVNDDEVSAELIYVGVYLNGMHSYYFTNIFTELFDVKQMDKMIENLAKPTVRDIRTTISNL